MEKTVIQLRGLNEVVYCKKLYHLMYAQGIFYSSADTIEGKNYHNVREKTEKHDMLEGQRLFSMNLYAMEGTLVGKLDGIRSEHDEYVPIEDKNNRPPEWDYEGDLWGVHIITSVWNNDFPQIVGQMYLLRKNGYPCSHGRVYYRAANAMIDVPYKEEYDQMIENAVNECLQILNGPEPDPLVNSDKCIRCSLNWACLPDEINTIKKITEEPRRLYPGRPDTGILYVTAPGTKIGKSGECLTVYTPDGLKKNIPQKDVEDICIYGNVQVTTQAIYDIIKNGGSIFYFTSGGWLTAITMPPITRNIFLRIKQFEYFGDKNFCIHLIRNLVFAKISNQRTLIRRNRKSDCSDSLMQLKKIRDAVESSDSADSIRGFEGNASKLYWECYPKLLIDPEQWKMQGRNRRPPRDEINAMLSYGYSLLLRDMISALTAVGLDYLYGFFHVIVPGRPALALDMMEPYRPLLVDSVVLRIINEGVIIKDQFQKTQAGVFMSPEARKKFIYMYESRMDEMITHPIFGYRLSYRRMLHLEARLLSKYIIGEIENYIPLITR